MTSKTSISDSLSADRQLFAPDENDLSSHRHRLLIGLLGLFLPLLLYLIDGWRPTKGLERWELLNSVSAYYYTGAVAAFVGILVAIGVFLVTYSGYRSKYNLIDRLAAIIAGVAAFGVAFFPTNNAPLGVPKPPWWTPKMGTIHDWCAVVLFIAFICFSLFLFPKSNVEKGNSLPRGKWWRNLLYRFCGWAMVFCIGLIVIARFNDEPIFWPEAVAVELFAVSWLTKGRADWTLGSCVYFGRHPGHLVGKIRRVIRDSWSGG